MKTFDVFGIGNPLVDLLAHVPDQFLDAQGLVKNRMYLVDLERQQKILSELKKNDLEVLYTPGGSCANSMIGMAQLGGATVFGGKIARDEYGTIYKTRLVKAEVVPSLGESEGATGSSLILVTDDASRTMNTHLGISQNFQFRDISRDLLKAVQILYIEGYLWDTDAQKEAILRTIDQAREYGVKISLSLSDPFCVERHAVEFNKLCRDCVELLFCNQEEAFGLTGSAISQDALQRLNEHVETVAMTMGSRGALIAHRGRITYVDPFSLPVVDSTGAGDAFAAGFLYGITQNKSILESGRIAAAMAALVISQLGPRFQGDLRTRLHQLLSAQGSLD